ncbi:MAG: ABC transporter permease [Pseudomonadota bacterium]
MIREVWTFRDLLWELSKRDFVLRYRGSYAGFLWSLAHPVSMLAVYSLAFGIMLGRQGALSIEGAVAYSLALFPGLALFQALAETLNKAPFLISGNPAYVKKIVFPLALMPLVTVIVALAHTAISLVIWTIVYTCFHGRVPWGVVFLPFLLLLFTPVLLAVSLLFSALGVYLRDLGHFTGPAGQALLFLSPIFYSIDGFPPVLHSLFLLNPLTTLVEQTRAVLEQGRVTDWNGLAIYLLVAMMFAWGGWRVFKRLRDDFADLL